MARSASFEGRSFHEDSGSDSSDLTCYPDMINYSQFDSTMDANNGGLYDGGLNLASNLETIYDPELQATTNTQTVSPKDLLIDAMPAPPSGTFTDFTTPGTTFSESPFLYSTDTSPSFGNDRSLDADANEWVPLFSEEECNPAPDSQKTNTPSKVHVTPQMSRNDSSPGKASTRSSNQGRHSFTAGIAPKRRDKPLPAIHIEDPTDSVAVKRARNTLAARKSREKRVERTEALLTEVQKLQEERDHWKSIAEGMGYVE